MIHGTIVLARESEPTRDKTKFVAAKRLKSAPVSCGEQRAIASKSSSIL